jgi:hypothetical protein
MPVTYDRSFAPYVVPAGIPTRAEMVPDLPWLARMLAGQVRAAAGETLVRAMQRVPSSLRSTSWAMPSSPSIALPV